MKILIGNVHSVRNAGDAVLTLSTVQQLRNNFPSALITLAMNDPTGNSDLNGVCCVGSFTHWAKKSNGVDWHWANMLLLLVESFWAVLVYRLFGGRYRTPVHKQWQNLIAAYLEMDIFVSSAGNFLYTSGRFGLPFVLALYTMITAVLAGKPLYMMPQTIGPLNRSWERWLLARILSRFRLLLVRDEDSLNLLEKINLRQTPVRQVIDSAFSFQGAPTDTGAQLLQTYNIDLEADRPLLGVSLINWEAQNPSFKEQDAYEGAVTFAIGKFLTQYDAHAIMFSQVHGPTEAEDDRIPAKRVYERLQSQGYSHRVCFMDRVVRPAELKAAYGWTDLFLGTRLHANIFALSEGVPVVAIQYQPKTRGVLRTLTLEKWVVDISTITGPALFAKIRAAWEDRVELRFYIGQKIPIISDEAALAGRLIADDYRDTYTR